MRLLIVRHAAPDYATDTLTPRGRREAELLAGRLAGEDVSEFFVSPQGRAQETAAFTLQKLGREAETLEWLHEFPPVTVLPEEKRIWHVPPKVWTQTGLYYDQTRWREEPIWKDGIVVRFDRVIRAWDAFLAAHGYVRDGRCYKVERPNHDTIVLFCHTGITSVLLSRLLNVSPVVLWHSFSAPPTGVTTALTEEREQGYAEFHVIAYGDTSHLYAGGEKPSRSTGEECFGDRKPDFTPQDT